MRRASGGGSGSEIEPVRTEIALVDLAACGPALFALEAETPRLSDEDEARIARLADANARDQRRAAHIALRLMLERHAGPWVRRLPYARSSSGKPTLSTEVDAGGTASEPAAEGALRATPHFSLSHTAGHALIVVSGSGPWGIDIERERTPRISGERRLAIERAAIELAGGAPLPEDAGRDARFLTAWVRLEAVAKADGLGVGAHLSVILGRRSEAGRAGSGGGSAGLRIAVHDLVLPDRLYGAVAGPWGREVPAPFLFPAERVALRGFVQEKAI